ncbi:MAG TPA: threonine synthase, partial [Reyranella sp.]|nr:threonine synthase [Reyranella sp.]
MRYISTRHGSQGSPAPLGFEEIMLAGLARDGGLYLPAEWPHFSPAEIARFKGLSYAELAFRIMQAFVGDAFDEATFRRLIGEAYGSFETPEVAPLK